MNEPEEADMEEDKLKKLWDIAEDAADAANRATIVAALKAAYGVLHEHFSDHGMIESTDPVLIRRVHNAILRANNQDPVSEAELASLRAPGAWSAEVDQAGNDVTLVVTGEALPMLPVASAAIGASLVVNGSNAICIGVGLVVETDDTMIVDMDWLRLQVEGPESDG